MGEEGEADASKDAGGEQNGLSSPSTINFWQIGIFSDRSMNVILNHNILQLF
jgi:hypothetical protein